ncbi:hypothetical protein FSP39_004166 [Pinctada imbricata]|uniref:palmitoyl-protein hydrolase n=1 Tax=Pinctada imbricata TaxID=66713 RepID=A0AA88Y223_PINIB|nr:hypothetical protein FSP39_004166 [Pinctada imbricata]
MPYTPYNGHESTVWFDRRKISASVPEEKTSIDATAFSLSHIIQTEVQGGIPPSRIVIGGFSMGAAMSMHLGYRYHRDVAGVFALSGFLNHGSSVYEEIKGVKDLPLLFQCHGTKDELVSEAWGKETYDKLTELGVKGEYHTFDIFHEFNKREILMLREWILKLLPE